MNESLDLNSFYKEISNKINIVSKHLEDDRYNYLFKACRLKPFDLLSSVNDGKKVKYCNKWFDEFGNSLIINNKQINIIYNDCRLDKSKIISTDLYDGLDIDNVLKISTFAFIAKATDEFKDNHYIICLLGIDNYFRVFKLHMNDINKISPLYINMMFMLDVLNNKDKGNFFEHIKSKRYSMFKTSDYFMFSLPLNETGNNTIKKLDYNLAKLFQGENKNKW